MYICALTYSTVPSVATSLANEFCCLPTVDATPYDRMSMSMGVGVI